MGDKEKDWASRAYAMTLILKPDTTPERIKDNRKKMLPLVVEAEKMKKSGYKDKALDEIIGLYYHFLPEKEYIEAVGHKSTYNIDDLESKVRLSLAELE